MARRAKPAAHAPLMVRVTDDDRARWQAALGEGESLSEYVREACDHLAKLRAGNQHRDRVASVKALRIAAAGLVELVDDLASL